MTILLWEIKHTLTMPLIDFEFAFVNVALIILSLSNSVVLAILPITFVVPAKLVLHSSLTSDLTFVELSFIDFPILFDKHAETMGVVLLPLPSVTISILIKHFARARLLVRLEEAIVRVTACLYFSADSVLFVVLYLAFENFSLLCNSPHEAVHPSSVPHSEHHLTSAENFHCQLVHLALLELPNAKASILKDQKTFPIWLAFLVRFTCVEDVLTGFGLVQEFLFQVNLPKDK